jgi:hypothetical protein
VSTTLARRRRTVALGATDWNTAQGATGSVGTDGGPALGGGIDSSGSLTLAGDTTIRNITICS